MHIFVTGATGHIGTETVKALLASGHTVLGLARSDKSAAALQALGAESIRGSITDLESLKTGAAASDGVIHLAFGHDFSRYEQNCAEDQAAISAMGSVLEGTGKPLITSSGTLIMDTAGTGELGDEDTAANTTTGMVANRAKAEVMTKALAGRGVRAMVVRFPPTTHGDGDAGFVPFLINKARETGFARMIGDGKNRWPAGHKKDAARMLVLAVEKGVAGRVYHATTQEGVTIKSIMDVISRKLDVPQKSITLEEAKESFGFLAVMLSLDVPVSSKKTQEGLGWTPTNVGLLEDMENGTYFEKPANTIFNP